MQIVRLKQGKEIPILNGHPWVFSGAIDRVQDESDESSVCRVLNSKGHFVAQGIYNQSSRIAVRILSLDKQTIDRGFFASRIQAAMDMRKRIIPADTTCFRLINAEGDGLPGLIIDQYGDVFVIQIMCPGMDEVKDLIVDILKGLYPDCIIHERSDMKSRKTEGLPLTSGPLLGNLPDDDIRVKESGINFVVDVCTGDRTGFYLDRRICRQTLMRLAKDRQVLDLFSYSGAFGLYAIKAGARHVVSVDSNAPTQALLKKNMEINRVDPFAWRHIREDAMAFLGANKDKYDIIICDPPPFASQKEDYVRTNALSLARLSPGGLLFSFASFSPGFSAKDLLMAINEAARKASRKVRVIETLCPSPDFPYLPSHSEGINMHGYIIFAQ